MLGSVSRPDPLLTPDALGPKASRFCARGDPCAWGRENLADTEPCQQTLQKINTLQNQGKERAKRSGERASGCENGLWGVITNPQRSLYAGPVGRFPWKSERR